ncbi:MAG: hypothetical protein ABJZ55_13285 [Fuerstiella sp.]
MSAPNGENTNSMANTSDQVASPVFGLSTAVLGGASLEGDSFGLLLNVRVAQRKGFTTPLRPEVKKRRNTSQSTKKKPRCQRGGVHGVAIQNATTERIDLANRVTPQGRSRGVA